MSNEEILKVFKSCKNKTEAYKAFSITPNSKGIITLKELAEKCNFDLKLYIKKKKIGICKHCGKEFKKNSEEQKFCSCSCSVSFNNKTTKRKYSTEEEYNEEVKKRNREYMRRKRLIEKENNKKCSICGCEKCLEVETCKHTFGWFKNLECFGFDITKIGSISIYEEYAKIKKLLYEEYIVNKLSPKDIALKYSYKRTYENILHLLKTFDFKTRNQSESIKNGLLTGNINLPFSSTNSSNVYKHGWHTTWEGKKIYYRSSYELEYAISLDEKKIKYDVEHFRIKYWDSVKENYRIAIPDFYLNDENKIIEIKSRVTFNKQNMIDKFNEYKKLGFEPYLILEKKIYYFDDIKNIEEYKFITKN